MKGQKFDRVKRVPPTSFRLGGVDMSEAQKWEGNRASCLIGSSLTTIQQGSPSKMRCGEHSPGICVSRSTHCTCGTFSENGIAF